MSTSSEEQSILNAEGPDRFKTDMARLRRVLRFVQDYADSSGLRVLPVAADKSKRNQVRSLTVAEALLSSGCFPVKGFLLSEEGVQWDGHDKVPHFIRPYAYLSHLLRVTGNTVELLFGPPCPNDVLMYQWEPFPSSDKALVLGRLTHFIREGTAICPL